MPETREQTFARGKERVRELAVAAANKQDYSNIDPDDDFVKAEFVAVDTFKKEVGPFLFNPNEVTTLKNEYVNTFYDTLRTSPSSMAAGKRRRKTRRVRRTRRRTHRRRS
jgi:hypothetical protein